MPWLIVLLILIAGVSMLVRPAMRRNALRLVPPFATTVLFLGVSACLLFTAYPDLAPVWLVDGVAPIVRRLREEVPLFAAAEELCGSIWPLLTVLAAASGVHYHARLVRWARHASHVPDQEAESPPRLLKDLLDS